MRTKVERLAASWRRHQESDFPMVVLRGADSNAAYADLMENAGSISALNRLPTKMPTWKPTVEEHALDNLAKGVPIRVVYDTGVMANRAALATVEQCVSAGEQARVLPGVPWTMFVTDHAACLTLDAPGAEVPVRAFTRSPDVLSALRHAFESWWNMAIPVSLDIPDLDAPADDRRLLTLLSAGLTDHAIARELGVSERTVRRRITRLQAVLAGHTRFQLGVQAARRGWLDQESPGNGLSSGGPDAPV
ncbi:helix-turn-helix domain-containing protein [Nocardioides sp. CCNWLW239]|uniref:helix-turn-helix transcriptional regulator n=1 Tax=Nocardioides sp. CCNWLW239 TaxID=3128902 RepID=UPI003016FDEA